MTFWQFMDKHASDVVATLGGGGFVAFLLIVMFHEEVVGIINALRGRR